MKTLSIIILILAVCLIYTTVSAQPVKFISKAQADSLANYLTTMYVVNPDTTMTMRDMVNYGKVQAYRFNQTFVTMYQYAKTGQMAKFKAAMRDIQTLAMDQDALLLNNRQQGFENAQEVRLLKGEVYDLKVVAADMDGDEVDSARERIRASLVEEMVPIAAKPLGGDCK